MYLCLYFHKNITKPACPVLNQVGMDLHYQQAGEPLHSLRHLSAHSWSQPQRAASLHLRATLNRATAQHLSLVSDTNTLTHYLCLISQQNALMLC